MKSKTIGVLFKVPAILLLIAAFFGGIYAAMNKIAGVTYASPIIIGVIVVLYFIGEYTQGKSDF